MQSKGLTTPHVGRWTPKSQTLVMLDNLDASMQHSRENNKRKFAELEKQNKGFESLVKKNFDLTENLIIHESGKRRKLKKKIEELDKQIKELDEAITSLAEYLQETRDAMENMPAGGMGYADALESFNSLCLAEKEK